MPLTQSASCSRARGARSSCSSVVRRARGCRSRIASRSARPNSPANTAVASSCSCSIRAAASAAPFSASAAVQSRQRTMTESAEPESTSTPSAVCVTSRAHTLSSCASSVSAHSDDLTAHSLMRPSEPDERSCKPLESQWTLSTDEVWPSNVRMHEKSLTDHTLIVMSPDEDARALSTGEKASDQMARLWPLRHAASRSCRPSSIDHSLIVRSWEPDAAMRSLGASASALMSLAWPSAVDVARGLPRLARMQPRSHSLSVLSFEPVSRAAERRRKASAPTASTCPSHAARHEAAAVPHTRAVQSLDAEPSHAPSALTSRARTRSVWPYNSRQPIEPSSNSRI
mmetsp:Transcript_88049/g.264951  ORF Transcript_88049/g.264951 Transcript_88049/m.264951 type:complete len:342 (+) Transcript_88049:499-1524(+)